MKLRLDFEDSNGAEFNLDNLTQFYQKKPLYDNLSQITIMVTKSEYAGDLFPIWQTILNNNQEIQNIYIEFTEDYNLNIAREQNPRIVYKIDIDSPDKTLEGVCESIVIGYEC